MCAAGVWSLSRCRSQSQQQISNKTSEKENYQGAAVVQLKSRPEPDWDTVVHKGHSFTWLYKHMVVIVAKQSPVDMSFPA